MMNLVVILCLVAVVTGQELMLCKKPITGMSCEMMCHFPATGNDMVKIIKGTNQVAACDNSTTCVVKSPEYTGAMLHWMDHGDMRMVHFTIKKLDIDRDADDWSCSYGNNASTQVALAIYSKPSSCQLVNIPATEMKNASLRCNVNCTYPKDEVEVTLMVNGKATTETANQNALGNLGCSSTSEENLMYTWPITVDDTMSYKCQCSVKAIDWMDSDSIMKKMEPEDGMSTTTVVAIVIIVVVVIVALAIAILLIKKKRNSKGGATIVKQEDDAEKEEL